MAKKRKDARAHMKAAICSEVIIDPSGSLDDGSVTSREPQCTPVESAESNELDYCAMPAEMPSETSPYTTPTVTLSIGASSRQYNVHKALLSQSPKLAKCTLASFDHNSIELPEVNEDLGHTLVHYLYTGTYQTPKLQGVSQDARTVAEYKRSVHAYFLAKKFGLKGLEDLAEHQVACCDRKVSIFDVLDTTEEVHRQLSGDGAWLLGLKDYLKRELQVAFGRDETIFTTEGFLDRVGNNKEFNRALVKSVVDIYTEKIVSTAKHAEYKTTMLVSPPVYLKPAKTVWVEESVGIKRVGEPVRVDDFACMGEPDPAEKLTCEDEPPFIEEHHCVEESADAEEPKPMEEPTCWKEPANAEDPPCAEDPASEEPTYAKEPECEDVLACVDESVCSVEPTHVYHPWRQSNIAFSKAPVPRYVEYTSAKLAEATPTDDLLADGTKCLLSHPPNDEDEEDPRTAKKFGRKSDEFEWLPHVPAGPLGSRSRMKVKGKKGRRNYTIPDIGYGYEVSPAAAEPDMFGFSLDENKAMPSLEPEKMERTPKDPPDEPFSDEVRNDCWGQPIFSNAAW